MIIDLKREDGVIDSLGRLSKGRQMIIFECDREECGKIYERPYKKFHLEREFHFCSKGCAYKSNKVKLKRENTCLEKHGYKNNFMAKDENGNIKRRQTKKKKYGSETYNNMKKNKETKLDNYGDENYNNRKQSVNTCIEKYGVECSLQDETVRAKGRKTMLEKYGADHPMRVEEFRQAVKQTKFDRYGDENYNNIEKIITSLQNNNSMAKNIISFSSKLDMIIVCRSNLEKDTIELIFDKDNNILSFQYETIKIKYWFDGDFHFYYPDFLIENKSGRNKIIETKSDYFLQKDYDKNMAKFKAAQEYCIKNNLEFECWNENMVKEKILQLMEGRDGYIR